MRKQEYPDKSPYHSWRFVNNGGLDIASQLQAWYDEHPSFAVTNHQYGYEGNENGNGN